MKSVPFILIILLKGSPHAKVKIVIIFVKGLITLRDTFLSWDIHNQIIVATSDKTGVQHTALE